MREAMHIFDVLGLPEQVAFTIKNTLINLEK